MKTIEIKVYKLNELPEEIQEKAIEKLSDINVNYDWRNHIYQDAETVGIAVNGHDERGCSIQVDDCEETANKILEGHGDHCETYKTAKSFLSNKSKLVEKYSDGINKDIVSEDNELDFDNEMDDLEKEFTHSLSEDYKIMLQKYRIMLQKEYEYMTSEKAIKETIEANDYDFTIEGNKI